MYPAGSLDCIIINWSFAGCTKQVEACETMSAFKFMPAYLFPIMCPTY